MLRKIDSTLRAQGVDALSAHRVKRAAIDRVFGFEILPAPFVIAHLQLGLFLQNLGAPLDPNERAGVFLTNALTGWEPVSGPKQHLPTLELEQERDAAEAVKRDTPILVVIGNPPYNAFAGVSPDEEQGLVEPYKEGLISKWGIKKFNLDDLYVRFFRLAERRITEMTGRGVVCYISNFSYVDKASFVVMRERFLNEFDHIWIDRLNGDSRETGKRTPDGKPDPSIFSTRSNKRGIQKGTAIGLMVRRSNRHEQPVVQFRNLWGTTKREDLLKSLEDSEFNQLYDRVNPTSNNRFSLRTLDVSPDYLSWPTIEDLASRFFAGIAEDRGKALIDIDKDVLEKRMKAYFDPQVSWEELDDLRSGLTKNAPRFDAKRTRDKLIASEGYDDTNLVRIAMRPMDYQWCYYTIVRPLWREPRPEYWETYQQGTVAIVTRAAAAKSPEGPPLTVSSSLCDYHMMPPNSSVFPITVSATRRKGSTRIQPSLFGEDSSQTSNISAGTQSYLTSIGFEHTNSSTEGVRSLWAHCIAIAYSPLYLGENRDGIRDDWPRIPLPINRDTLLASADLGSRISRLLDTQSEEPVITSMNDHQGLRAIGNIMKVGGGSLRPGTDALTLSANWGYLDGRRAVMPGVGKAIERSYTTEEREALGQNTDYLLGATTLDVYLNNAAYWSNVPEHVWNYTIGGYQVIKKWLSYREHSVLGRELTTDEVQQVTNMARRIAALILLEPELDRNYAAVKSATYPWPSGAQK